MDNIVTTAWLAEHSGDLNLVIADTRWVNGKLEGGRGLFAIGHIPGAVFVDLDTVLSDRSDLTRGRHPLPDPEFFARVLADCGIGEKSFVVAYDDVGGSIAARLWWMMKWVGCDSCAVLDGGITKWIAEGRDLEKADARSIKPAACPIKPRIHSDLLVERREFEEDRDQYLLIDARAPERYRGEIEPIDSRAGHIPGAINISFAENLTDAEPKVFRDAEQLRTLYKAAGVNGSKHVVCYCGSGVTACHNLLALSLAGIDSARLYPGSWSEWICHHSAE